MNQKFLLIVMLIFPLYVILAQNQTYSDSKGKQNHTKEIKTGKYEKTIINLSDKIEEDTDSSNDLKSGIYTETTNYSNNDKYNSETTKPKSEYYKEKKSNVISQKPTLKNPVKKEVEIDNSKKVLKPDKSISNRNIASSKSYNEQNALKSHFPKHLIIVIDRSGSMKKSQNFREELIKIFNQKIPQYAKEQLHFSDDDYVSYVSFGFYEDSPDINNYIEVKDINGRVPEYGFLFENNLNKINQITNYFKGMSDSGLDSFFRKNYSGVTFAEEMALAYVGQTPNKVSETYIATLTDGEFNAMNATHEISDLKTNFDVRDINEVTNTINRLSTYYTIKQKETIKVGEKLKLRISKLDSKLEENFNINRLVNFMNISDKIKFFETPNGYAFSNKIEILDGNEALKIENIYINLINAVGDTLASQKFENPSDVITIDFEGQEFENADELNKIIFDFDVYLKDGVYNSSVYSSRDLSEANKKNFSKEAICSPAKFNKIFGLVPMPKLLYKTSNAIIDGTYNINVLFWNIILSVILGSILFIFFVRYIKRNKIDKDSSKVQIK